MASIERRTLLRTTTAGAVLAAAPAVAQDKPAVPVFAAQKATTSVPVTHIVARYAATAPVEQIPAGVRKEAARTLLNWVGCAVGGSTNPAPGRAVKALQPFSGPPQASLFGRKERLDAPHVALVNGISSHVLDYDDTLRITTCRPVRH